MARYRRWFVPGGTYFFTLVTFRRRPFLTDLIARAALRQALREVRTRHPFSIDAIVLLPDHLHTVWSLPPQDDRYSLRWRQIKSRFTQEYLERGGLELNTSRSRKRKGERGVLQRRFFEHTVRDEADLKRCVDYVHINPLKHGLVTRVADWPWSSFHRYVVLGEYTADWGSDPTFYSDEWLEYE
jgi:putative transposase